MQTVTQHGRTAKDRFELVIRLQQSRGNQPADAGLRLRAQALLKDILMSRLEVEAEINAHEYVHTQGFDDLGRALAASRALQVAFEGFRNVVPAARANVSVVLDSSAPDEAVSGQASLSVEQKDLLDFAKPSQVLITQAFYDRIAHYQPALRTFPLRAGVYEFLWTSEQRLNELQAEAEFMPTLIQPPPAAEAFDETVVVPVIKTPPPEPRWKAAGSEARTSAHARNRGSTSGQMALYGEDSGDQRCGRGPAGSRLSGVRRRLWQVDEAGGGEFTRSTTACGSASPGLDACSTRPESTSHVQAGSAKGERRSVASSQAAKAFHEAGSWPLFPNDRSQAGERAQLLTRRQ